MAKLVRCPRCGKGLLYRRMLFCSQCGAPLGTPHATSYNSDAAAAPPLWETAKRKTDTVTVLLQTIGEVILHPDSFFRKVAVYHGPAAPSLSFGLAVGSIGLIASWCWSTVLLHYGGEVGGTFSLFIGEVPLPWLLIGAPAVLTFQFLCTASYIQIFSRLSHLQPVAFSRIFRVLCYAEAVMVLQLIPVLGTLTASIVWVFTLLSGLRHLFSASRLRILFSLLLPFLLLAAFILVIIISGVLGGIIAGAGLLRQEIPVLDWLK